MLGSWESPNDVTVSVACAFSVDVELNRANERAETDAGGKYELAFNLKRSFRTLERIGREAMDDNYRQKSQYSILSDHAILPAKHTARAEEAGFIKEICLVLPLTTALDRLRLPNILAVIN
jgi:hypothetical protein